MKMIVTAFLVAFVMIALVSTVFGPSANAQVPVDYDTDDDGLIEVASLAQLGAIRWDLDGDGAASSGNGATYTAAFPNAVTGMGCNEDAATDPEKVCIGYELTADLDTGGVAWTPIGEFTAKFEGNGNTISNLLVSGPATNAGLFAGVGIGGEVRNLGLTGLTVSGASGKIAGGIAGTLTGDAQIKNSYVTGTVTATGTNSKAGGLAGSMVESSQILKSYTAGTVTATGTTSKAGGLTGTLEGTAKIENSYATASVTTTGASSAAGGLAAFITGTAQVKFSYATGAVSATGTNIAVGGLLAAKSAGTIFTDSYWDTTTTGQSESPGGGTAKNTSQLQSPTSQGGIYTAWSAANWDFGTANHYLVLKADWDGDGTATATEFGNQLKDYDTDDDGLIEVPSLAQLNAIRWDLDGNGAASSGNGANYAAAFPMFQTGMGCNEDETAADDQVCIGYELTDDLDFDTDGDGTANSGDTYWNDGAGWVPIGGSFTATFEGNGHVISNIFININSRSADHGLFAALGSGGSIKRVGLDGGSVSSAGAGTHNTGGLVGLNRGTIEFSYSSAAVTTSGYGGGLVGSNQGGTIMSSYATGAVSGFFIGGLVGIFSNGEISDSYATGALDSTSSEANKNEGGLVRAIVLGTGTITNSYSTGGEKLLAANIGGTVTASYWDSTLGSSATGVAGTAGKTTSEMQSPTSNTGIYTAWSAEKWDFGTTSKYPALKADWNGDGVSTAAEFGNQYPALAFADDASINDIVLIVNTPYTSPDALPAATGGSGTRIYSIADLPNAITLNSDRKLTGTATAVLAETTFTYTVTDIDDDTDTLTFKLSVIELIDYDTDDDGLIKVANLAQLNAIRWDLNGDGTSSSGNEANYAGAFPDAASGMGCPATGCIGYELTANLDFDTNGDGTADSEDTYWNGGKGWTYIGTADDSFTAEFEGNGKTIANLFIQRSGVPALVERNGGLFGVIGTTGEIRNLGLTGASVTSGGNVGVIAGTNAGSITASYADGDVGANGSSEDDVGGGLVGSNTGSITGSYSRAKVFATTIAGGLVGMLEGSITDSYAALGVSTFSGTAGGLVGSILTDGSITDSYSVAPVIGTTKGGLVAAKTGTPMITASYWDTELSGQSTSPGGGTGKTTSELQSPTSNTGIYSAWETTRWDFVDANHFPLLKADWDDTSGATWQEFGDQEQAPDAPAITSPGNDAILYQSAVTITGTSSSGIAIITVFYSNNTSLGTATSDADGDWSMTKSLNDADYSIKATVTKNDKTSLFSDTVTFTVDTSSLPAKPVITSPGNDAILYQSAVTIKGTSSSANAIITVFYSNNTSLGTATSDADGDWSMTRSFGDADYSIKATVTKNDKTSLFSDTVTFTVDTSSLPAKPVITSPGNDAILYQSAVTITGTSSSANATITVFYSNDTSLGTATSDADGDWSMTRSFGDADYSIKATVTKNDKTSLFSDTVTFTVDTSSLPVAPVITSPTAKTFYTNNITFAGTSSSASSLIKIYDGNRYLANATSDNDGVWSVTKTLEDGTYSITATATKDGKTSLSSNSVLFTITTVFNTVFADINDNAKKDKDEPGIADVTVIAINLKDIQTIYKTKTDKGGIYKFENNSVGQFLIQVAPVPKNHKPSSGTTSYTYTSDETKLNSERLLNFPLWPVSANDAAIVKGSVFNDLNNDNIFNDGETGFAGVNVFAVDFLTVTIKTAITDADGDYMITGVLPDLVLVQIAPIPAGFLPSSKSYAYHILPNSSVTTADFPLRDVPAEDRGVITMNVFHDTNENGVKDAGESSVKYAVVYTYELLTAVSNVQTTGASGVTIHANLIPDIVLAQINASLLPEGFTKITTSNAGSEYVTVTKGGVHGVQIGLN